MNLFKRCACPDSCKHPWWYRFRLRGRLHRGSTKTTNKHVADRLMHGFYNDAVEGKSRKIVRTTLNAAIQDYLALVKKDQATWEKSERVLKEFEETIGDRRIGDISTFLIEKWRVERSKDVGLSTVNRELNVIKGFLTQCVTWKLLPASPATAVRKYKTDDIRVRVLTSAEMQAVLKDAPTDVSLLCRATLECLPRLSELLSLRREHIGSSWIEVRRKGGRVQRLPVTDTLRAELLARVNGSGFVFGVGDAGEPPSQQVATNMIARHMAARGVLDASHHTFRHTGVTIMLEAGVNPRVIQQLAGWTSLRMLERYGHVRDTEARRAIDVTSAAIESALNTVTNADTAETADRRK